MCGHTSSLQPTKSLAEPVAAQRREGSVDGGGREWQGEGCGYGGVCVEGDGGGTAGVIVALDQLLDQPALAGQQGRILLRRHVVQTASEPACRAGRGRPGRAGADPTVAPEAAPQVDDRDQVEDSDPPVHPPVPATTRTTV